LIVEYTSTLIFTIHPYGVRSLFFRAVTLPGYFQLLKNGQQIELDRGINDVVIDIFKKGIKGKEHVS
jgi:hypothetical protein